MDSSSAVRGDSSAHAWEKAVKFLIAHGEYSPSVRGPTIECLNFSIIVDQPDSEPKTSRKSPLFFAHETFPKLLREHPRIVDWGDEKLDQAEEVVRLLRRDPLSRRAVIGVWNPTKDLKVENPQGVIALIFAIRSRRFHLTSVFRTTDAWMSNWTLTAMTALQGRVFNLLMAGTEAGRGLGHVELGPYSQFHASFHMYLDDVLQARAAFAE